MFKRLLIPLDPSLHADKALKFGIAMAKLHGAELTGLVILDIPGIEHSIGPVPLGAHHYAEKLEKAKEEEARKRVQVLLEGFHKKCEQAGVRYREAESQGSPSQRIIEESLFYDAVVIGLRTFFHFETQKEPGDSLEEILDHSATPIFGVPADLAVPDLSKEKIRVLVAFDGSLASARALQRFAQFAPAELMEVVVLTGGEDREVAQYYLDQAEAYLELHSITNVRKEYSASDIIQAVDEKYLDWATMVVLGAHSKKGLLDFLLGSLTKHLIEVQKKPLLIGQ